jgi:uncharacterized membrane protein YheB (UPF0754 family)
MHTALVIALGVAIAALIGGVTNYLAIRMLFRPHKPKFIGSWRIPFTPGLIPKRHEEIAAALGRVVAEYLVTSDALSERFASDDFANRIAEDWTARFRAWIGEERKEITVGELADRWLPAGWLTEETLSGLSGRLDEGFRAVFERVWVSSGAADKPLAGLIPGWTPEKRKEWAVKLAKYAVDMLGKELASPAGERLIVQLTKQLVDQAGGFLGAMAALFMDEYKVAARVRMALLDALSSEAAGNAIVRFFEEQLAKAETKTVGELLAMAGLPASDAAELAKRAGSLMRWDEWLSRGMDWQPVPWLEEHADRIAGTFSHIALFLLQLAARHAERLVRAIRLEEIVERQVKNFPIGKLEEVIVSISGREFRAITWLGALLGGIIGLVQGILLQVLS